MITEYIELIEADFKKHGDIEYAKWQKNYLKNQFEFYGLNTPSRRKLQQPYLDKRFLPSKLEAFTIIKSIWEKPQRELQYFALDLAYKYRKLIEIEDIDIFEYMIINKSWWDTVDGIATKLIADYMMKFPEIRDFYSDKWLKSGDMWLQRTTIIYQLSYKEEIDTGFLSYVINFLLGSKEFFINKAIGWMLRQYSKTDPEWVEEFVTNTPLHPLSKKEALRLIL